MVCSTHHDAGVGSCSGVITAGFWVQGDRVESGGRGRIWGQGLSTSISPSVKHWPPPVLSEV